MSLYWSNCSGFGSVYSTTIVRQGLGAEFHTLAPYILAIVELEEGPHLFATLHEASPIGTKVRLSVRPIGESLSLPVFSAVA